MGHLSIASRLDEVFARHATDTALSCNGVRLSYRELEQRSAAVAARLLGLGLSPGSTLGLEVERSIEQLVLLVGMVRAGLSYCYLDRSNPPQWNQSVCERSGVHWRITQEAAGGPGYLALEPLLAPTDERPCWPQLTGAEPVYVNFSSGTTGAPKIIPCTHRGVLGFCDRPRHFPLQPGFRMLYASNLTFDASQFEIWTALLNGGELHIHVPGPLTLGHLRRYIHDAGVDSLWLTSTLFNTFIDIDRDWLRGVQRLMVGGEVLSAVHIQQAYATADGLTLYNGYGPTENTMGTCVYAIPRDFDSTREIPIGHGVDDAVLLLVRADGQECDVDEPGELLIAGDGLSPGYLGDAALTRERFIERPWQGQTLRCYRSGDLVSRDGQGLYHFHGRSDDQIKLRGQRLSLTEVAAAFKRYPGMLDCAVLLDDRGSEAQLLLVYLEAPGVEPGALAEYGRQRLPPFMLPQRFVGLERFPLRASGKLDIAELKQRLCGEHRPRDVDDSAAGRFLARFGVLAHDRQRSFFDNGGNSLGAIKLVDTVNRHLGREGLGLEQFYRMSSLQQLLDWLQAQPVLASLLERGTEQYYVTPLQQESLSEAHAGFSINSHLGRFAVVRATSASQAREALRNVPEPLQAAGDSRWIGLNKSQLSMVYAELLHKDLRANNVLYLFRPEQLPAAGLDLATLAQGLKQRYPLAGCRVARVEGEYCFDLAPEPPARLWLDAVAEFPSQEACVEHFLQRPLSLFEEDLCSLFKVRIDGVLHLGLWLHHILGNHVGQLSLLRSVEQLAQDPQLIAEGTDFSFIGSNLMQVEDYERLADGGTEAWEQEAEEYAPLADVVAPVATAQAVQMRTRLAMDPLKLASPQRLFHLLQAFRQGCVGGLGIEAPIVNLLFAWAEQAVISGFSTYTVPVPLTPERFAEGCEPQATMDYLNAKLARAALGYEEILAALGLYGFAPAFLCNFVELPASDAQWLHTRIANPVTEWPKTLLDLTVVKSAQDCEVLLNSYLPEPQARAFLESFVAAGERR
ncbi:AMP-binding protein [Pseudomonas danubii]|uniref:AMP-binding protein n=1 Tax=Pseudomonas danubii TaxID=2497146 RepID=UPI003857BACF